MTDSGLQLEWQSEHNTPPWQAPIPWKELQFARLDLFIHRHVGVYMTGLMVIFLCGSGAIGVSITLATENYSVLACVLTLIAGSAGLALSILILIWRTRREWRPASAGMIAALRRLIPAERWDAVAEHAAERRRYSPRNPARLTDILGWLDLAVVAEKRALPLTPEEAAVIRKQTSAFG